MISVDNNWIKSLYNKLSMVVETACDCVNYLVYSSNLGCVHGLSLYAQFYVPS